MLLTDLTALIKVFGNVEDTTAFTAQVQPYVDQTMGQLKQHACVTNNTQEVQKLIDSGLLKATLDIFVDYFTSMLSSGKAAQSHDETFLLSVGESLMAVLASKSSSVIPHLRLYAFRALSLVCKAHPGFRSAKTADLIQIL